MGKFNKQAKKTLKEEGLFIETVHICKIGKKHYGMGFLYAPKDIKKSTDIELNRKHIEVMKRSTGKRIASKEIYFLQENSVVKL